MYQSRLQLRREARLSQNQGCRSEVWFGTRSRMTLRPCAWAAVSSASKSLSHPADAKPSIAIAFDHEAMPAVLVGVAVLFSQEIDEELALLGMLFMEPDRKRDLARLGIEIVHKKNPIVAPVISHHEHSR